MKLLLPLAFLLTSCAPFTESTPQRTTVGVTLDHEKARQYLLNIFSKAPVLENDNLSK